MNYLWLPYLTIVHQIDGTISILQAANEEDASEDFEEGWSNNEQFLFALPDNAVTFAAFQNNRIETFDAGWNNDTGLLDDFTETVAATATFSVHSDPFTGLPTTNLFENFEGYWPAAAIQPYTIAIPNVIFGVSTPTTVSDPGLYTAGNRIIEADENGYTQYADILILTITAVPKTTFSLEIHFFDKDETARISTVIVNQDLPIGTHITAPDSIIRGIRYIDDVIEDPTNGFPGVVFEGEPGVLFDSGNNVQASWVRAEFA